MKPNHRRGARALIALAVVCASAGPARPSTSLGAGAQEAACPLEIVGIWKPQTTAEANPMLLSFSTDGWVSFLESAAETRAQDFDVAEQARYQLDASPDALRIAFQAGRGNEVLPAGTSWWEVAEYGDSSFTTLNRESGERSYWARVQTHRYFLTLAARPGVTGLGGGPAFLMWTTLDGRSTSLEALGVHVGRNDGAAGPATFGRIPAALAAEFAGERDEDGRAMLRIELSEAEYRRTHAVFASWDERARTRSLPVADPYRLVGEFIGEALDRLNLCGATIQLPEAGAAPPAGADDRSLPRHALLIIQWLRAMNERRHVSDGEFPAGWQPQPAI
jgi:hypothetical protein